MSAIPAAITSLVSLLQDATDSNDVTVHDGQPVTAETPKYICVGYDPDSVMAVEFAQSMAAARGPAGHSRKEEFDILCLAVVTSGDSDLPGLRADAFELVAIVETLLRTQPGITLNGALGSGGTAQLSAGQVDQGEGQRGDAVAVRFRVSCKARI